MPAPLPRWKGAAQGGCWLRSRGDKRAGGGNQVCDPKSVPFWFLMNTLPQGAACHWTQRAPPACRTGLSTRLHSPPTPCPAPQKGAKRSTYSSKAHHWRSAVGGGGGGCSRAHLGRDVVEACVSAGAGEGAIHLVVAHHGKGRGVGAGDGDGCAQGRSCKEADVSLDVPPRGEGPTPSIQEKRRPPGCLWLRSNLSCLLKLSTPGSPPGLSSPTRDPHIHSPRRFEVRDVPTFFFIEQDSEALRRAFFRISQN